MVCKTDNITIGLLDFSGAQKSALFGLVDFFETASILADTGSTGQLNPVLIKPDGKSTTNLPEPGSLNAIICPPRLRDDAPLTVLPELEWLVAHHGAGCVMCSVCAGAFVLAQAGLLDGRSATTHWRLKERFQAEFPDVRLETEKLLIDDGDIITAGGVMAWVDLGLRLIERFHSPALMLNVARHFLVEAGRREQRYYSSFAPQLGHGNKAILKVQHWLQQSYPERQTIKGLAEIAGMSERTFLRQFQKRVGLTPISYLQSLRVEKARSQLELSSDSFSQITWQVGYGDPAAFRKIFLRIIGLSPQEYRRRFGVAGLTETGS